MFLHLMKKALMAGIGEDAKSQNSSVTIRYSVPHPSVPDGNSSTSLKYNLHLMNKIMNTPLRREGEQKIQKYLFRYLRILKLKEYLLPTYTSFYGRCVISPIFLYA